MSVRVDFYYWAAQCPLNTEMLALLQEYAGRLEIHQWDISHAPALAKRLRMFYPTLTVVNGRSRYFSPLRRDFLESLCRGELPAEQPYRPRLGTEPYTGTLAAITEENYPAAGACTGAKYCRGWKDKIDFLKGLGLSVFGWMNTQSGFLLGGAEFLPSLAVPYDIPREKAAAFITCVYLSDSRWDYKSAPLAALENYLAGFYRKALVISDEAGVFPNGDLAFFRQNGYRDLGVVAEEPGYCTLHLLEKQLNPDADRP